MNNAHSTQREIQPYLTVKDLMPIFRCGRDKAYKICQINGFPAMKMQGTYLVNPEALKKWMTRNHTSEFL